MALTIQERIVLKMTGFLTAIFAICLIFVVAINLSTAYQAFLFIAAAMIIMVFIGYHILKRSENNCRFQINYYTNQSMHEKGQRFMPLVYFIIILLFSIIYWLGFFPGGYNLDADGQWLQAHGLMQYNDWHPFVSTLLIQLILKINDSFEIYIVIQIIAFSAAVSYLLYCIQAQGVDCRILLVLSLYIGLNPAIGLNTVCMTKDVQFTVLIIVLTGFFVRVVSTEGDWLNHTTHILELSIVSIAAALVRHNGVLFVAPAFLSLLSYRKPRAKVICSVLLVLFAVALLKGPVGNAINVEKHDNVLGESMGIPMGMMANALITDEENIPQEVHSFLNTIADDEQWNENYITGEWDSCKWIFGGIELLKNNSALEMLEYTAATIQKCPQACYESFRGNTRIIWSLFTMDTSWVPEIYVEENSFGIQYSPIAPFKDVSTFLMTLSQIPVISFAFWNVGLFVAVMLLLWLTLKKTERKSKSLLVFPLFAYIAGTMLLLSGPNQRYFYCGLVLIPPTLLSLAFIRKKEKANT